MITKFVTVGVQYSGRGDHHPAGPYVHKDGYLSVSGEDEGEVRRKIVEALGSAWSFDYSETEENKAQLDHYHPLGLTGIIDACDNCGQVCVLSMGYTSCEWCKGYLELQEYQRGGDVR